MADLEPASALAERILSLYCEGIITTPQVVAHIEADRAAVREAALREALKTVRVLEGEYFAHNRVAGELALRNAGSELEKLLTEKRTHG